MDKSSCSSFTGKHLLYKAPVDLMTWVQIWTGDLKICSEKLYNWAITWMNLHKRNDSDQETKPDLNDE